MATLSPARAAVPLLEGLECANRGKVRDTYRLPDGLLLVVATDGISIFDFVLNALVPQKGMILTAMTHFWLMQLEALGIKTHFVAAGAAIDQYLPEHLRGNTDLQSRAMVVRSLTMLPVEFIARACLTGSGLAEYKKSGTVCGVPLPPELQDGDLLPYILDTPTTKAVDGHDEALPAYEIRAQYPEATRLLLQVFDILQRIAKNRGIVLADTKFEFGVDIDGIVRLGDEVGTPDSSRFWERTVWTTGRTAETRRAPPPYDKQLMRVWGLEYEINKRNPLSPEDVNFVHGLEVPEPLLATTTQTYRYIFWRLTGMNIESYLRQHLNVSIGERPTIAIVLGSQSDKAVLQGALHGLLGAANYKLYVVSCHRNPLELIELARSDFQGVTAIVAAGGMAFALPGVLDALLHAHGRTIRVIGIALGESESESLRAAQLSISQLPGQPVIMDEVMGRVYTGPLGLREAVARIVSGELPPPKPRATRPFEINEVGYGVEFLY